MIVKLKWQVILEMRREVAASKRDIPRKMCPWSGGPFFWSEGTSHLGSNYTLLIGCLITIFNPTRGLWAQLVIVERIANGRVRISILCHPESVHFAIMTSCLYYFAYYSAAYQKHKCMDILIFVSYLACRETWSCCYQKQSTENAVNNQYDTYSTNVTI